MSQAFQAAIQEVARLEALRLAAETIKEAIRPECHHCCCEEEFECCCGD